MARDEARFLLTEDKDFGQLVFAEGEGALAVVLLRYRAVARRAVTSGLLQLLRNRGDTLQGAFVVVQPGKYRIAGMPSR